MGSWLTILNRSPEKTTEEKKFSNISESADIECDAVPIGEASAHSNRHTASNLNNANTRMQNNIRQQVPYVDNVHERDRRPHVAPNASTSLPYEKSSTNSDQGKNRNEYPGENGNDSTQNGPFGNQGPPGMFTQNIISNGPLNAQQIRHVDNMHIGNVFNFPAFSTKNQRRKQQEDHQPQTPVSPDILESSKAIDRNIMQLVSREIGYNWKRLARQLDLDECDLEEIEHDNMRVGLREMAYKMLEAWFNRDGAHATVGNLAKALCDIGRVDIALKLDEKINKL